MRFVPVVARGACVAALLVACGSRSDLLDGSGGAGGGSSAGASSATGRVPASPSTVSSDSTPRTVLVHPWQPRVAGGGGQAPAGEDAGTCVRVDSAEFDTRCIASEECMPAASVACNAQCVCTDTAINVDERNRYDDAIATLPALGICNCPAEFAVQCVHGTCVMCRPGAGCTEGPEPPQ